MLDTGCRREASGAVEAREGSWAWDMHKMYREDGLTRPLAFSASRGVTLRQRSRGSEWSFRFRSNRNTKEILTLTKFCIWPNWDTCLLSLDRLLAIEAPTTHTLLSPMRQAGLPLYTSSPLQAGVSRYYSCGRGVLTKRHASHDDISPLSPCFACAPSRRATAATLRALGACLPTPSST